MQYYIAINTFTQCKGNKTAGKTLSSIIIYFQCQEVIIKRYLTITFSEVKTGLD